MHETVLISANAGMPCRPFRLDMTGLLPGMGYKINQKLRIDDTGMSHVYSKCTYQNLSAEFLILGYNLRVSVKYI